MRWNGRDGASKWTPLPARRARRGVHSLNYPACTAQVTTPRPTATVRVAPQDCSLHYLTRGGAQLVLARHVVHSTSQLSRTQAAHGADRCHPFASCCMHAARNSAGQVLLLARRSSIRRSTNRGEWVTCATHSKAESGDSRSDLHSTSRVISPRRPVAVQRPCAPLTLHAGCVSSGRHTSAH